MHRLERGPRRRDDVHHPIAEAGVDLRRAARDPQHLLDALMRARGRARSHDAIDDVGRGQLDFALYKDSRVVVMDRVNARYLDADAFPEEPRLITVDVSFISLLKVVPALLPLLAPGADLVTLIKPQFEAPRGALAKGGILRDEALREQVVDERSRQIAELGLDLLGLMESPVAGRGGNREALAHFRRGAL